MNYFDYFPPQLPATAAIPMSAMLALMGFGLGAALFISEPRSRATQAQALAQVLSGLAAAMYVAVYLLRPQEGLLHWLVYVPVIDTAVMVALFFWTLAAAQAAQPTPRAMAWIKRCAWLLALSIAAYMDMSWLYPEVRMNQFVACLGLPEGCNNPGFWRFSIPVGFMMVFLAIPMVILFEQKIDPAERARAFSVAIASPFYFSTYILPQGYNVFGMLVGYLIVTGGALRYHSLLGERGAFMARFLSPEVSKLVRVRGMEAAMKPQLLEITAVCCDLRGFTRFSQMLASDQVVRLLNDYYEAVGRAVAEFGATIKDYAGDGILILIGAPIADSDHAAKGVALSRAVQKTVQELIQHWAGPETRLGIGIGVASGKVTVGAVGSSSRMEYTAVGPAVNLAARLCSMAQDAEILVDARTRELARTETLNERGPVSVKGMGEVPHYSLAS